MRLLSLQMANNETGVLQPVAEMAAAARAQGIAVHTDAVQAAGRVPIDLRALGVDYLSLSAHKLGGPKGIGALVIDERASLPAFIVGGGQERRRRAGTENVAAIAGFGAAAEAARRDLAQAASHRRTARSTRGAGARRHAGRRCDRRGCAQRLPNTTSIALPGASAETLVIALDLAGVAVSAGAACSSGKVGASHVLQAMGVEPDIARAAIRVSLGCEFDASAMWRPSSRPGARRSKPPRTRGGVEQDQSERENKMAAVQQTIDQVKRIDVDQYKYGFETDIESVKAPKGLERGHRPLHLAEEERAGLDAGVAARGLPALADHDRAGLGQRQAIPRSTSRISTTTRRRSRPRAPRASPTSIPSCCAPTRSLASPQGARYAGRGERHARGGRCRVRLRLGGHHLQGRAGQGRRHLLLDLGGAARASASW